MSKQHDQQVIRPKTIINSLCFVPQEDELPQVATPKQIVEIMKKEVL